MNAGPKAAEVAKYEVCLKGPDGGHESVCRCADLGMAHMVAKSVALVSHEPNMKVYVTEIPEPGHDFVPGGGRHDSFWRDEDGKLRSESRN